MEGMGRRDKEKMLGVMEGMVRGRGWWEESGRMWLGLTNLQVQASNTALR